MPEPSNKNTEGESNHLTHFDRKGAARMVDVSEKPISARAAEASGLVRMQPETLQIVRAGNAVKGDVLQIARLAGIMGAKQTANLIPLCHSIPLTSIEIQFEFPERDCVVIRAFAKADHKTGVEMEALTAVSIAALTIYDMCKAVDRAMTIESIQLDMKSGGVSGEFRRAQDPIRRSP